MSVNCLLPRCTCRLVVQNGGCGGVEGDTGRCKGRGARDACPSPPPRSNFFSNFMHFPEKMAKIDLVPPFGVDPCLGKSWFRYWYVRYSPTAYSLLLTTATPSALRGRFICASISHWLVSTQ